MSKIKTIIWFVVIILLVIIASVCGTYSVMVRRNLVDNDTFVGSYTINSSFKDPEITIIPKETDGDKTGEYQKYDESGDVEIGIWTWDEDKCVTLTNDDKAVAKIVYNDGKYYYIDANLDVTVIEKISDVAIVKE